MISSMDDCTISGSLDTASALQLQRCITVSLLAVVIESLELSLQNGGRCAADLPP